jgi:hypothetical protein
MIIGLYPARETHPNCQLTAKREMTMAKKDAPENAGAPDNYVKIAQSE